MTKNTVIYHRADYDGIFSREVARKFLPADTEFIGWDYGDEAPIIESGTQLYMIDISVESLMTYPGLTWIDHHKSAIDKFSHIPISGYRIDGVAACRLAYQWFLQGSLAEGGKITVLPIKENFINREVDEPLALTLAGEYDVWDHRGNNGKEFQFGLDSVVSPDFNLLLSNECEGRNYTHEIIKIGRAAMNCYAKRDADIMRERSFTVKWEGLTFLVLNTPRCNSNTFALKDIPKTGHDALMAFCYTGKQWSFSLYHANHNKNIDLSLIASKYGGGGHRGACGFRLVNLPF